MRVWTADPARYQPRCSLLHHHLLSNRIPHLQGALVMPLMALGLRQGTIRFVLISGTIPETR